MKRRETEKEICKWKMKEIAQKRQKITTKVWKNFSIHQLIPNHLILSDNIVQKNDTIFGGESFGIVKHRRTTCVHTTWVHCAIKMQKVKANLKSGSMLYFNLAYCQFSRFSVFFFSFLFKVVENGGWSKGRQCVLQTPPSSSSSYPLPFMKQKCFFLCKMAKHKIYTPQ